MKTHIFLAVICLSLLTVPLSAQTNTPTDSTSATLVSTNTAPSVIMRLQSAVTAYQRNYSWALAEDVAKAAAGMDELPPIPEEARKHFVMGEAIFGAAKDANDFEQAAGEFSQASAIAPWWAKTWNNMAVSREKAGDYDYALNYLKVYQKFKLSDDEARTAQDLVYKIQAEKDLAAKHTADAQAMQQQAAAAEVAKAQETAKAQADADKAVRVDFIKSIQGDWAWDNYFISISKNAEITFHYGPPSPIAGRDLQVSNVSIMGNILRFTVDSLDMLEHFTLSLDGNGRLSGSMESFNSERTKETFRQQGQPEAWINDSKGTRDCTFNRL